MLYYQKFFEGVNSLESSGVDWEKAQIEILEELKRLFPQASDKQRIQSFQVERIIRESNGYDSFFLAYMSLMDKHFGAGWEDSEGESRISKISKKLKEG